MQAVCCCSWPHTATSKKMPSKAQQCPTVVEQRNFRHSWKNGRHWLRYEIGLGMWCNIFNRHTNNRIVIGIGSAVNPLRVPTQAYRFYSVNGYENKRFHLHAVMLDSLASAHSVVNLTNAVPADLVPQVLVLFCSVYQIGNMLQQCPCSVCMCVCRMSTTSHMFDTCRHLPKILLTPADTCQKICRHLPTPAMAGVSFRYGGVG